MNTAAPPPDNGQYSTSQQRPFFYAQPTAQLPFPNPWYLSQLYNPYCIAGPGFRGGNPYFPYYSVALHEYPGFYVPQHQINMRMSRRPHFNPNPPSPMFYHATRFRHYSSPGRRTETKETQTDPRQQEYITKKHLGTDGKNSAGNLVSHSSGISTENDNNLENVETTMSPVPVTPERDFHKNSCNPSQYRNMPPGSYAYEKEEVRIEYGSGSPAAIQMWKSYKETIPIYDVAVVKDIPESVVQGDLFCEGVLYGPRSEGEEIAVQSVCFSNKEEGKQSASPKRLNLGGVQELETQTSLSQSSIPAKQIIKVTTSSECEPQSVLVEQVVHPLYEVQNVDDQENCKVNDVSEEMANEELLTGAEICPEKLISNQSVNNSEVKVTNTSVWAEDSAQKFIPSPTWLACFDNVETNYDYDLYMSRGKQKRPSILSITSEELSSRDEGSSMDNASVSYFVPDYMLRKGLYAFRKRAESIEGEKIQSSGSLKEDDVPLKHASSQYEKSPSSSGLKVRDVSNRNRKISVPVRGLSKRKLYSAKKKPRKSQSLSEPEDSEEYWVLDEEKLHDFNDDDDQSDEEYYFQGSLPNEQLELGKGNYFKQIAQKRILWKPPKGVFPAQLVGFPVREKLRVKKKGASEALGQVYRLKQSDYISYGKPERGYKEVTDQNKPSQKPMGAFTFLLAL
ncbi:uncharacterized protein LOC122939381 [Bufo gargarizans]|uniref:uncharacterized protein LOC122939381 n=1 Tax=Bufo gargarizans TaxID=30331 RepID=UPI001CF2E0FD|nr:uncharacterized protein LOC122939381 [Bufo gargarizans]